MSEHARTQTVKGAGLARGPATIVGLVLAVFGLVLFFRASGSPLSTAGFPDATVNGPTLFGFEANAWTAWFTVAAGVLLLVAAAQHLAAKTMSLVVGLALGAASVIAIVDGSDVFGLAAANGLTALGWGIAAAILLVNTLLPRIRHERTLGERGTTRPDAETRADERAERERNERERADQRTERERPAALTGVHGVHEIRGVHSDRAAAGGSVRADVDHSPRRSF